MIKNRILKAIILFFAVINCGVAFCAENVTLNVNEDESYLLLLNVPANTVISSNSEIVEPEILTTLYNEKNQVLVKTIKKGVSRVYISTEKEMVIVKFVVVSKDVVLDDEIIQPKSKYINVITKIDKAPDTDTAPSSLEEEIRFFDETDMSPPQLRGEY